MDWLKKHGLGLGLCLLLAIVAHELGGRFPLVGGPVFGILLGILVNNLYGAPAGAGPGIAYSGKKILQYSIILLGAGLDLEMVYQTGVEGLSVMVFTLAAAFICAFVVGRLLGTPFVLTSLIGMGTAICGGSAIAALAPIVEAEDKDVAYSISTVFLFNIVAVFLFPALGHGLGLSQNGFGLWAGTAINDTSSVVAAAYSYGAQAGDYATVVKLTRTLMIVPLALAFALYLARGRKQEGGSGYSFRKVFPWFVLGFLLMSLARTVGVLPVDLADQVSRAGKFLIIVALSAIGLKTDFKAMLHTGYRPLALGLLTWAAVAVTGILVQAAGKQW